MAEKKREIVMDPKYAPPYPQEFYPFWPKHVIKAGFLCIVVLAAIVALAYYIRVPTDMNMPPLPSEGVGVPGPEWYLVLLFQPFWYLVGSKVYLRPLFTFWLPLLLFLIAVLVPFILKGKRDGAPERLPLAKKIVLCLSGWIFWFIVMGGVVASSYHSPILSCPSCHNPMMGVRQATPPADVEEYYKVVRQRQIEVGKYRAGKTVGEEMSSAISSFTEAQTYKDANWQLRHFYEPTLTW